jgi:phospholipase C
MSVNVIGHSYLTYGARWVMSVTSAFQPAKSNINYSHQFLNSQAIEILRNDGYEDYARILEYYINDLNKGVNWADIGWKNITHYFNPEKGKGMLKFANAIDETVLYFNKAARYWREGKFNRSMFYLGAAAHIVQDMCVPHHATNKVSSGHRRYEQWVRKRYTHYAVYEGGNYERFDSPPEFAIANAKIAFSYRDKVKLACTYKSYHKTTLVIVPLAQLSTAEFFHYFLKHVGA